MCEPRPESHTPVSGSIPAAAERRRSRRLNMAEPALIRPADPRFEEEVRATLNYSRDGFYFTTPAQHYYLGMHVNIVFPYHEGDPVLRTSVGSVVRVERRASNKWGVAIKFLLN